MRRCHLRHPQSEVAVDQDHFASGDDLVANDEIYGIGDVTIQFHYVAGTEFKNLSQRHLAAAKTKCGLEFNVKQQFYTRAEPSPPPASLALSETCAG